MTLKQQEQHQEGQYQQIHLLGPRTENTFQNDIGITEKQANNIRKEENATFHMTE